MKIEKLKESFNGTVKILNNGYKKDTYPITNLKYILIQYGRGYTVGIDVEFDTEDINEHPQYITIETNNGTYYFEHSEYDNMPFYWLCGENGEDLGELEKTYCQNIINCCKEVF